MQLLINIIQSIIFTYLFVQVGYVVFFSVAAKFAKKPKFPAAKNKQFIRVFIPGYKEDAVIIDTVKKALAHDYNGHFEVIVIADSFSIQTLEALKKLPVNVLEVSFEKSTKGKALEKAIAHTLHDPADIAVVLDADNIMAPGFLNIVNNAFEKGYTVIQGHRTAKNMDTSFAFLDACTEEINNNIFRRGHNAVGLPSALIGSGMAFEWHLFVTLMNGIGDTAGEDKEIEFKLMRNNKKIAFLDGSFVYDEKISRKEVFSKQRSRWLAMQLEYFNKYFFEAWGRLMKGNIAFFNKFFQTFLLPRILLIAAVGIWSVISVFISITWALTSSILLLSLIASLLSGIPKQWYNRKFFKSMLQIPAAFAGMIKALVQVEKSKHSFVHTPHGENH